MAICAEPDVICQIPADVVRIGVQHDVIRVPQPVAAIVIVVRCDAEVEPTEAETVSVAALEPIDVAAADFTGEVPMLPGPIQVIVGVVAASVMTNPLIILRVNVRGLGMSGLVAIARALIALRSAALTSSVSGRNGRSHWGSDRCRAASGNVSPTDWGRSLLRARGSLSLSLLLFWLGGPLLGKSGS